MHSSGGSSGAGRRYFEIDHDEDYPSGGNIHYECTRCNSTVRSLPKGIEACECKNITVEANGSKVVVKDCLGFRAFEGSGHQA